MPDTGGTKRKSRAGSREDGDDDDTGKNAEKNELAEMQAWLDTVPLISVAPPKQVRGVIVRGVFWSHLPRNEKG